MRSLVIKGMWDIGYGRVRTTALPCVAFGHTECPVGETRRRRKNVQLKIIKISSSFLL